MPKAGDSRKAAKKADKKPDTKARAVAKPAAKPAPNKAAKNSPVKAAGPAAAPKQAPKPAAKPAAKPVPTTTGATGRDHPSQTEHSAQAEVTRKLYEQLQAKRNTGGAPGATGKKGGFDPNQFRGGKGNMGSAHGQMLRRTQSRGGGAGGGGGGGGGSSGA
jgi:hypothetical protein